MNCPKCNAPPGAPCAYPNFNFRDCPMPRERQCTLPDARMVVDNDRWLRIQERYALKPGELLRIPYSLWLRKNLWINPGLASDHLLGLPVNFFYLGIRVGDVEAVWGKQRKVPRAYLRVGYLLEWVSNRRIRCDFRIWNKTNSYIRCRYTWPAPPVPFTPPPGSGSFPAPEKG